jgi:hypothetical protein
MADEDTAPEAPAPAPDAQAQAVADIMAFDPFGPASPAEAGTDETGKPEVDGEPSGEGEGEVKKDLTQPEPKAGEAITEPPKQQGPTQREQELQAQVVALQKAIQDSKPQPAQPASGEVPKAKYNLGLPAQVIQGLRSEDEQEFSVAMHAVINGIANRLWSDMQEHLSSDVVPQIDQRANAVMQHATQVQQVHTDFYNTFPHLKNPAIMPVVQNAALQVATSWTQQGREIKWGKEFADDVAALVHQIIPQPAAQQQPTPKPKTFTAKPGTRPGMPSGNEYTDVL